MQDAALTRRTFLGLAAAGMVAGVAPAVGAPGRGKAPYRVLWNDDTTNIPKWTPGEVFSDDMLRGSINSVADKGIDAYMLSPGLGWIPWWKSSVYPDHYQWRRAQGVEPDCFGKYLLAGGDLVATLIAHCRKLGIAAFVSYRLNDNHHQEQKGSLWVSRFYEEHPEYLLNPKHYGIKGYSKERGQNWAIPEVRAYKLALIRELCEGYDLDGLELDFLRDDTLFRLGETTEEQRLACVSEFVRSVRAALDNGPDKSRRRYLSVRIPCQLSAHGRSGISVERFVDAGVDMFNLSNWYHTAQRTDLAAIRALAPAAALYLEMTHVTANRMARGYSTSYFPKTSNEQFYTTAHLAYARGADGVSFFNMQYNKRSYDAVPRVRDRAWLAGQPQYYFLGSVPYFRQVPVKLSPGVPHSFQFDMAPPERRDAKRVRLRIHSYEPLTGARFSASLNGRALAESADTSAFLGNPYDGMLSEESGRVAFATEDAAVRNGLNDVTVTVTAGGAVQIACVEILLGNRA